jgi:cation-transporting ATPase 13A1
VDVCCFDKTGTLTSDQFRVTGVVVVNDNNGNNNIGSGSGDEEKKTAASSTTVFSSSFNMVRDITQLETKVARVLGCCNSIIWLNGRMAGDPMEVATVEALGWSVRGTMATDGSGQERVTILKRFGFSSTLKRMSVVVRVGSTSNSGGGGGLYVLTKGAPEIMTSLYKTVPKGYEHEQQKYTSKGKRVLALGYKSLSHLNINTTSDIAAMDRTVFESKLICCGMLVLDSPLKPQSKPAISQLIASSHRVVVITGDNPLTACSVASQVGILSKTRTQQLILKKDLLWHPVSGGGSGIPFQSEAPSSLTSSSSSSSSSSTSSSSTCQKHLLQLASTCELCVTGGALMALAAKYGNPRDLIHYDHQVPPACIMNHIVVHVLVFARTAPVQKERILTSLKTQGYTTLMCGDGTNDVGALKQAHVGISIINSIEMDILAEKVSAAVSNEQNKKMKMKKMKKKNSKTSTKKNNEQHLNTLLRDMEMENQSNQVQLGDASVASGFTSKTASIACALDVIRQGRCTLVTTLQMYKILAVNCLVTAYSLSALYLYGVKQGDTQMTFVGLAVAAFFFFVSRSKPMMTLAPERPPSRVFSPFVLLSVFGQSVVHFIVQLVALKWSEPFIDPSDPSMLRDGDFRPNVINTVVFIGSIVTQANSFGANYTGEPFMESFRSNKMLSRSLVLAWFVAVVCATDVFPPLNDMLQLVPLPSNYFRFQIIFLYLIDTVLIFVIEKGVRHYYGTEKSKLNQS